MTTLLITGAAGFVGHHAVDYFLRNTDWRVVVESRCRNSERLIDIGAFKNSRCHVGFTADSKADYLLHLAARAKIDESISAPRLFVVSNIGATLEMLEFARQLPTLKKLIYFSTDEVFGPAPQGVKFNELAHYNSSNPYAAAQAAGEELCLAWANTYRVPAIITHCQNLIGERQSPEKLIPSVVRAGLTGAKVKLYFDPETREFGFRDYLHAQDAASAVHFLFQFGTIREKYNISRPAGQQISNFDVLGKVAKILDKTIAFEQVSSSSMRPGFSLRYGLDGSKLFKMGWTPQSLEESIHKTVEWMVRPENLAWLEMEQFKTAAL
jgi:dTDP-glucose 4,6-dehydratase